MSLADWIVSDADKKAVQNIAQTVIETGIASFAGNMRLLLDEAIPEVSTALDGWTATITITLHRPKGV